jgi:hypothetical protein
MRLTFGGLLIFLLTNSVRADFDVIGPLGINSQGLGLTGEGVLIGQVELGRPGKPGKDMPIWVHSQVIPTEVYAGNSIDGANSSFVMGDEGEHATEVAGVMIANAIGDASLEGVAPEAQLHSAAMAGGSGDISLSTAANRIARLPGMRAINISAGRELGPLETTDGNAPITQFIDWSARQHDVLYVFAGSEVSSSGDVPDDNYNGITVAASQTLNGALAGRYRQVWPDNVRLEDAEGDRTSIDIMAPGFRINVPDPNNGSQTVDGTSLAAPHVTATVALLQEHANSQVLLGAPRWDDTNARRHEVMKAILLNSADKMPNVHGSAREVVNKPLEGADNWTERPAYDLATVSLDERMGAGHLNATAAFTNFKTGEWEVGTVPRIGWDYGSIGLFGSNDYVFSQPVSGYVAATLSWDRRIEKTGDEDSFSSGDIFFNSSVSDLDIYLLPANTDDLNQAIRSSVSFDENLEHIFFNVPGPPANYKLKVVSVDGNDEDYGLAWWAGEVTPGDFDADGDVDADDLSQFQGDFGANGLSDGDNDSDSDGNDFLAWQRNLGTGVAAVGAQTAVPEPAAWMLCALGAPLLQRPWLLRRRVFQHIS